MNNICMQCKEDCEFALCDACAKQIDGVEQKEEGNSEEVSDLEWQRGIWKERLAAKGGKR